VVHNGNISVQEEVSIAYSDMFRGYTKVRILYHLTDSSPSSHKYLYYYLSKSPYKYYTKTYNKFILHGPYISNKVSHEDNSMDCSHPDKPNENFKIYNIENKSWFIVEASRKVFLTEIMANAEIKTQTGGKSSRHKRNSRKIKRRSKLRSNRRR